MALASLEETGACVVCDRLFKASNRVAFRRNRDVKTRMVFMNSEDSVIPLQICQSRYDFVSGMSSNGLTFGRQFKRLTADS